MWWQLLPLAIMETNTLIISKKISSGYILCTKTKMKGMSEYVTSFIFHTHYELHSQSEMAEGTLYSYSLLGIRKTPTKNTCEVFSL